MTETCSSRLQARDEEITNCYLKFFDMINKIYKIIVEVVSNKLFFINKMLDSECEEFFWEGNLLQVSRSLPLTQNVWI